MQYIKLEDDDIRIPYILKNCHNSRIATGDLVFIHIFKTYAIVTNIYTCDKFGRIESRVIYEGKSPLTIFNIKYVDVIARA